MGSADGGQVVAARGGLSRRLGLGSATALVVGEVIGVGIFLTPAGMAKSLGSPAWLLGVWLATGAVALCGALCFGALAACFPEAGGGYIYLRRAYGPLPAFLYGWMSILVLDPGITAALAVGLVAYLPYLAPGLSPAGARAVGIGAIVALAAVNAAGVGLGAGLLRGLTALKLGLLGLIVAWGFGRGLGDWSHFLPLTTRRSGSPPLAGALAGGAIGAFFSFGGWWDVGKVAGEVRDPGRTMPRALVLGVATVTAAYVAISAVFLYLVPLSRVADDRTFAAQAGEALFGRSGGTVFAAIVVMTVLGSLAAMLMAAPRVAYAMALDGALPRALAALHPRAGTPYRAIALQAALACGLAAATDDFGTILGYFTFAAVAFLALTVAALFVLDRDGGEAAVVRPPGYPATPLLFLIPTALLLILLAAAQPIAALSGVAVVLLGVPAYYLTRPRASVRAGRVEILPIPSTEGDPRPIVGSRDLERED